MSIQTLYLIGSGFDKGHGIKTGYMELRTYIEEHDPEFLYEFERQYDILPLDESEPWFTNEAKEKWIARIENELWSTFEENIGYPNVQDMLDFSESVVSQLDLDGGNYGIIDTMDEYWKGQYSFVKKLQVYVKEWIESLCIDGVVSRCSNITDCEDKFYLTFNYTNVLENVYRIDPSHILHIHGGILPYCDIPPVLGHGNTDDIKKYRLLARTAADEADEANASIYNAIAEYLENTLKNTQEIIKSHRRLFERLRCVNRVVIIGMSLGTVDAPYLWEIKNRIRPDAEWEVYYYDDKAKEGHHKAFSDTKMIGSNLKQVPSKLFFDK